MPALLLRHRVTDVPFWQQVFEEQGAIRWSNGCRGARVFRNTDDPGEVLILFDWDDLHRARLYSQSDELQESLRMAGIIDDPDVWILEHTGDAPS